MSSAAHTVYVGVGSNIAPREHIPDALRRMADQFAPLTVSPVYTCPAVGFDGAAFLNLVVGFDTVVEPLALVDTLRDIEARCGRRRQARSGSRTMDLDLLLYGDRVMDAPGLRLPRGDILRYAFVLKPLADIAGNRRHPVNGRTYSELWAAFDAADQPLQAVDLPV